MFYRAIALLSILCLALGASGCRSSKDSQYEEVLMPLQTGSVLQRRVQVPASTRKSKKKTEKTEKKEKEKEKPRKPEAEPSATPAPEEEATPPPERFR